jgi:hypothetical protein
MLLEGVDRGRCAVVVLACSAARCPPRATRTLRDFSAQIRSPLFLAHVRAASGGMPVQQTNCHPFRHGRWLFQYNGYIAEWPRLRRELTMAVAAELHPCIEVPPTWRSCSTWP